MTVVYNLCNIYFSSPQFVQNVILTRVRMLEHVLKMTSSSHAHVQTASRGKRAKVGLQDSQNFRGQARSFQLIIFRGTRCFKLCDFLTSHMEQLAKPKTIFFAAQDKCHPNPCYHDGKCETEGLDYVCTCPGGWTGNTCEGKANLDPSLTCFQMDDSSYRQNFDLDKKNKIHHHSCKEHLKMSKIAKFGCKLL